MTFGDLLRQLTAIGSHSGTLEREVVFDNGTDRYAAKKLAGSLDALQEAEPPEGPIVIPVGKLLPRATKKK